MFHEEVGHEGIEVLLGGESGVRKFANFVYNSVGKRAEAIESALHSVFNEEISFHGNFWRIFRHFLAHFK